MILCAAFTFQCRLRAGGGGVFRRHCWLYGGSLGQLAGCFWAKSPSIYTLMLTLLIQIRCRLGRAPPLAWDRGCWTRTSFSDALLRADLSWDHFASSLLEAVTQVCDQLG